MTKETIKKALREMDCLEGKEIEALAELIHKDKREEAHAVIDWLFMADRITLENKLDMKDLI